MDEIEKYYFSKLETLSNNEFKNWIECELDGLVSQSAQEEEMIKKAKYASMEIDRIYSENISNNEKAIAIREKVRIIACFVALTPN